MAEPVTPPVGAERSPGAATMAAFSGAVVIGSANFIAVRFSNRELAPFWGAWLRFGLAALIFVAIALALRLRWPRGRALVMAALYGGLGFGVSYALLYWALVRVTAGVSTVVLAVAPLSTLLLATAQGQEQLRWRGAVGGLLALGGIAAMTLGPGGLVIGVAPLLALLGCVAALSQGIIVAKGLTGNHPVMTNAVGMSVAAVLLLAVALIAGEPAVLPSAPRTILSVLYLGTVGSIGLFMLLLRVVRDWTASATSYTFVLFPVVTIVLGAWLADEPITGRALVGAALVMVGVWFGALSPGARAAPPTQLLPAAGAIRGRRSL